MFRKLLHLQPQVHTGKLLHHRHTSYRGISLLIIVASSFLFFIGVLEQKTSADFLEVTAKVSAPIPTIPAVITQPTNNTAVDSPIIAVKGTCDYVGEATIVSIYDNGEFAGSTLCTSEGLFSIEITLSPGSHQLIARTNNITNDFGPDSAPVTVIYTPKTSEISGTIGMTPGGTDEQNISSSTRKQLRIKSKEAYLLFGPSKSAIWQGSIEGGSPPYSMRVDWGDGRVDLQENINEDQSIFFKHQYKDMKSYDVIIRVEDKDGFFLERVLVAVTPYIPAHTTGATLYFNPTPYYTGILAYLVIVMITLILWFDAKVYVLSVRHHGVRRGGRHPYVHT